MRDFKISEHKINKVFGTLKRLFNFVSLKVVYNYSHFIVLLTFQRLLFNCSCRYYVVGFGVFNAHISFIQVDASLLCFVPRVTPLINAPFIVVEQVVKAIYSERRKTIRNSLR